MKIDLFNKFKTEKIYFSPEKNLNMKFNDIRIFAVIVLLVFCSFVTKAQTDTVSYRLDLYGLASSGDFAPFWLQNQQYGKISSAAVSTGAILGISKEFNHRNKWFDYGFGASALVRTDANASTAYFHQLYAKVHSWIIDFEAGMREEHIGVEDASLSSGGLIFSENARPVPKITLGILNYIPIPFTAGYAEIKGAISHGWFTDNIDMTNVLLHHKYVFFRFGGRLPLRVQYGFEHAAQWGGNSDDPRIGNQPTGLKDFKAVFLGKSGGDDASMSDRINTLGNHIIGQSLRVDIQFSDYELGAYWQNMLEDPPIRIIGKTMNTPDGLWGLSVRNKKIPFVNGFLYEYFNTTDQSGPFHDKDGVVYGGNDSYYTGQYPAGWSYYGRTLGNALITSPLYNKDGNTSTTNNRVHAHHFGLEGNAAGYNYRILTTYSKNYGYNAVYLSPAIMKQNLSVLLEVNRNFKQLLNTQLGCALAFDKSEITGNTYGIKISVSKKGELFKY